MKPSNYSIAQARSLLLLLMAGIFFQCSTEKKKSINYLGQKPPGLSTELFAPGLISTDSFEHSSPAFSPDGSVVLWTVVSKSFRGSMMEMKYENGKWSAPHRASFADSTADDYYPCFSVDGKKLYFSSRRKLPDGYQQTGGIRIWEVERTQNGWGNAIPFDTTISRGQEYAHSITKDGVLYFTSSLSGGINWSLHRSEKTNSGYTNPVLLPYSINSVDWEDGPCIAPDESFLIFESQRPEGIEGSGDLYISFKNSEARWSLPVNMGPKINSAYTERFARLSPDGKYLFFGSNRNQSDKNWGFDIYWIDAKLIDELRNEASAKNLIDPLLGEGLITALYKNDTKSAAGLLKQWLDVYPNSLDATVVYSAALRKQQQYSQADQLLTNSSSGWNKNSSIIMEAALIKYGLNKDDKAVALLAPILTDNNQLREKYIYLSNSLLDMMKFKTSDEYFEKAMTIFPSSIPYYNRACTLVRKGEKDRAFIALNKAVEHGGYNVRKYYENDPDLASLKSDPRWGGLMKRLK